MNQRGNKKNESKETRTISDLQDNMKCSNIRIIGVPEKEDKTKDLEKIPEEVIVENFPKMVKEIITQTKKPRESQTG